LKRSGGFNLKPGPLDILGQVDRIVRLTVGVLGGSLQYAKEFAIKPVNDARAVTLPAVNWWYVDLMSIGSITQVT